MARPQKTAAERRSETLPFRVTPAERAALDEAAARAGLAVSEYVRAQALSGRVVVRRGRGLEPAAFDALRRIGVNLNQLARLYHQHEQPEPAELRRSLERLEALLDEALGDGS